MSGVKIYSIYLNNIAKAMDTYSLTKNLSSSNVNINDVLSVAKDMDDMCYLSKALEGRGEKSLIKNRNYLKDKLPTDSKGIILSDIGVNVVSKEVLRYCGTLLEEGVQVDTKDLGRLFKDISNDLDSVNSLSAQLLGGGIKSNGLSDKDIGKSDIADIVDDSEFEGIDDIEEDVESDDFKDVWDDRFSSKNDIVENDTDNSVIIDDLDIGYTNSKNTVNDKLATVITKASTQLYRTPKSIQKKSKTIYKNVVDFDN